MNEVIKNLWQTGTLDGPIRPAGFDVVVNLEGNPAPECAAEVLSVPMLDGEVTDGVPEAIRSIASYINMHLLMERKVLVYCSAGWNRSGVVVARTLMGRGFNFEEAIAAVRKARGPSALSNPHFVAWLKKEDPEYQQWLASMGAQA